MVALEMPISSPETKTMNTKAQARYRRYFIDLAQVPQGRYAVTGIAHSFSKVRLSPPMGVFPDQASAEQAARGAIDDKLSLRRRLALRSSANGVWRFT